MKFNESLKMDNGAIKSNRIEIVTKDLDTAYTRCIEDIEHKIIKLKAAREDQLDMSSDFKDNINVDQFDAIKFVNADLTKAIAIRDLEEHLILVKARHAELF